MKGLLIKDFKLMKGQKKFFLVIIMIAVWMAISMKDTSYIIGYMTFLGTFFAVISINYDEFENGYSFLFTLPVTRKSYVAEKYAFGMLLCGSSWLIAVIITLIVNTVKSAIYLKDTLMASVMILPIMLLILAVILPVQLKFGSEKGRFAIFITAGFIVLIFCVAEKIAKAFNLDLSSMLNRLSTMNTGMLITVAIVVAGFLMFLSSQISISIMVKKEF